MCVIMVLSHELKICLYVLVLISVSGKSLAYPNGADSSACVDMVPQHGYPGQTSSSPYAILLSSPTYKPNATLQVTIVSVGQPNFEGFLIQALSVNYPDVTTPVGSFQATQNTHALCADAATGGAALTHGDKNPKTNLTLTWNAPATAQGNLVFVVTVVQKYETFWVHRALANVSGMTPIIIPTSQKTTIPTTTAAPTPFNVSTATCGRDKSCIYSPSTCSDSSCDFILTWKPVAAAAGAAVAVHFELQAVSVGYVAVGFSKSTGMSQDSIVACVRTNTGSTARQLFSTAEEAPEPISQSNLMNVTVQVSTSIISCTFLWNNDATARANKNQLFDLSDSYYVILAKGPAENDSSGHIHKHDTAPLVSDSMINMTSDKYAVYSTSVDRVDWLIKIHGALMVVAWMLCGGTSIILARYYKKMWLDRKHCGEKVWFAWHRVGLIVTLVFTVAAVTVIFVYVGGWSPSRGLPMDAHPFIGIVATGFCVINPIMAAFRCSPGSKDRYLFNWAHWFVGTSALILAGAAILIGLQFDGVAPSWLLYLAAAYVAFYVLVYFTLWLHDIVSSRTGESQLLMQDNFPLKEEAEDCCCSFKCATFVTYLLVTVGVTATIVYVICSNSASTSSKAS